MNKNTNKRQKQVRGSTTGRPIMRLLDALGRRWSLRIMWELKDERLNFRDLQARCDNVSPTSLNQRLKELRELQLIDLDEDGFGYTTWGRELGKQLGPLYEWSIRWGKAL